MSCVVIICLSNNYDMQKYSYILGNFLKRKGYNVKYVLSIDAKVVLNSSADNEQLLISVPQPTDIFSILKNLKNFIITITRNLKEEKLTLIFINSHPLNFFIIKKLKALHKVHKIIHFIHDPLAHPFEGKSFGIFLYNKTISRMADYIIVFSNHSFKLFQKLYHPRNLVKINLWDEWMDYYPVLNYNKVLFFGRLHPYKGIKFLPTIAKALLNINKELIIAGKPHRKFLKYKKRLNRLSNVLLIEKYLDVKELTEVFRQSTIVILPYIQSSQSGVIIEAYKHSRPVIAFDVGGISEFIKENISGFVVKKGDVWAFIKKLEEVLDNMDEIDRLAYNAWKFGSNIFTIEKIGDYLIRIIDNG